MLVDQNMAMVCGSNTDQRNHFPRIHVSTYIDVYPYFPFDPPTQSDTWDVLDAILYLICFNLWNLIEHFNYNSCSLVLN